MVIQRPVTDLVANLEELARSVKRLEVAPPAEQDHPLESRDRIVQTIRSYLIPRFRDPQRPLLVVFAGPTGAGKSTLLNSVAGFELSRTGPLRPTTESPLVFAGEGRSQAYHRIGGVECRVVSGKARILGDLTLVDTPDIDSTASRHRAQAETLIDNADVVIFVSSAMRYADLVPWEVLRRAESRGAPVIPVLNRLRSSSDGALNDYRRLLRSQGLGGELVAVPEYHLESGQQMVPAPAIRNLRARLVDLVQQHRNETSDTVMSVLASTLHQTGEMVDDAESWSEELVARTTRLDRWFVPDVDRLELAIEPRHLAWLDPDAVAALRGSRRFRIRRFLSRNGPTPPQISEAIRRVGELATGSVVTDLRRLGRDTDADFVLDPLIPPAMHRAVAEVVRSWTGSVQGSLDGIQHPYRNTALVLLLAYTLEDRPVFGEALREVAPDLNTHALRTAAKWRLEADLVPIYETLWLRLREALGLRAASGAEIREARAALTALTIEKSRAHA